MVVVNNKINYIKFKKGFTLVELMAVIIIIGVVLLIVIPNVSGVLKRAEQKTFASSAKGIIRSANDYFSDDGFTVSEGSCVDADSGTIEFDKNYQITGGEICYVKGQTYLKRVTNGKYCATGNSDNLTVKLCSDSITVTFQVVDAFNNYFGYVNDNKKNIFVANSNDFAIINGYGSGDVDSIVIEVQSGDTLGTYIDNYKDDGTVSYSYSGNSFNNYMSYFEFWNIDDSSLGSCSKIVPAVWDKSFNSNTVISEDTTYNVLALGITSSEC